MSEVQSQIPEPSRRQFLGQLGSVFGVTVAANLLKGSNLAVAMSYANKEASMKRESQLFETSQMAVLHDVCAVVLPRTDTPSAAELDCHGFIEHQLIHCHSKQEQDDCKLILQKITQMSKKRHGVKFVSIDAQRQHQLLVDVEQGNDFDGQDEQRFRLLKALMVFGYFTTEIGATQVLNYQAIPGEFKGSIPYTQKSKAWGSLGFY